MSAGTNDGLGYAGPGTDNTRAQARIERRDSFVSMALSFPALLLVVVLIFGPVGWLLGLSFVDDGHFSLANYQRMLAPAYVSIFTQTFQISIMVTVLAVVLAYPLAYLMSQCSRTVAALLMIGVMLPFWTSLLVRTYAWMVVLQRRGIINEVLQWLHITDAPLRLVNNMTGTTIGMLHVMLPFMILPLLSSLRQIDLTYMNAASNMGASPLRAFWTVYFPLSLPGVFAGAILVFVMCLGFYVTPQLLGGGKVIMMSIKIQQNAALYFNWGAASALGVVLLVITLGLFVILGRFARVESMFGGK
ncbi:ABC transporter permease [Pseudooceanicola sp. CBS1P-1]|uniref:ABC transporter permease subunit n=1 Tax=Pseudooceanicola albus TaxID=2692189 RepID=A0A6L7G5F1_9RHOB|nr:MULTISPECIES: ABC transporter permease [Pseudooceanicola]MBT9385249.1 ABC transporter permease [Pseudooceanicola endophyticus]MXN18892.1 ABC transporter permease subunit [Pseudooceanicola albus]